MNPYESSDVEDRRPRVAVPMSAYVYSVLTFITVFGLVTLGLWYFPSKLLAILAIDPGAYLAVAFLGGLLLGAIAGIRTWVGFVRAHASRIKFEIQREQLQEEYGRGMRDS